MRNKASFNGKTMVRAFEYSLGLLVLLALAELAQAERLEAVRQQRSLTEMKRKGGRSLWSAE